jgi:hypothetical protein
LQDQFDTVNQSKAASEAEFNESRTRWEAERRELEARGDRQRQEVLEETERKLTALREQFEEERETWRKQIAMDRATEAIQEESDRLRDGLDAAHREREDAIQQVGAIQEEVARLRDRLDATHRDREAALQQVDSLGRDREAALHQVESIVQERDRLKARLDEAEAARRERERDQQAEKNRLAKALEQARRDAESASRLGVVRADEIQSLRAQLERQRNEFQAAEEEKRKNQAASRRDWQNERQRWLTLLNAARPDAVQDSPASPMELRAVTRPDSAEPITTRTTPKKERGRPSLTPRPQASSYQDPAGFRDHLERWIAEALTRLQSMNGDAGQPGNPAWAAWLEYELRTAREEIARTLEESPEPSHSSEGSAVPIEPA